MLDGHMLNARARTALYMDHQQKHAADLSSNLLPVYNQIGADMIDSISSKIGSNCTHNLCNV